MNRTALRDLAIRARKLLLNGRAGASEGSNDCKEGLRDAAMMWFMRLVAARILQDHGCAHIDDVATAVLSGAFDKIASRLGLDGFEDVLRPPEDIAQQLAALLDHPNLRRTWQENGEEAIGWIYQYFKDPDRQVFRDVRAPKVAADRLAAKTQLFTPRWIVEFLVQNTLGRLWLEMHPDSSLAGQLTYLVPLAGPARKQPLRRIKSVSVIDPACGTMHFGLVAFDLLCQMYQEELNRASEAGWPVTPSAESWSEVPRAVLINNLYGCDLDPMAVALSGLVLRLRAVRRGANTPDMPLNLYCRDVLRDRSGLQAVSEPGKCGASEDSGQGFDVVITNPPYLDSRRYLPDLKAFLNSAYPAGRRNLYGAFLQRCTDLLDPGGRLGIITPQTFMFVSSFRQLREYLMDHMSIETLVQAGLGTFPEAVVDAAFYVLRRTASQADLDDSVGTYFRLVRDLNTEKKRTACVGALERLRAGACSPVVYRYRQGDFRHLPGDPWVYWLTSALRNCFSNLPPLSRFAEPVVGLQTSDNARFLRFWWEVLTPQEGAAMMTRGDNSSVAFGCRNRSEAHSTGKRWFPHMKGGSYRRWVGNREYVVNWSNDGEEIRCLGIEEGRVASRPQNIEYYFLPGVTWTHTSSRGLSVRILPTGFICNVEGMAAYQRNETESPYQTLAILNSSFARHVIDLLNPTVHFGGREVGGLPYPIVEPDRSQKLEHLAREAVLLVTQDEQETETTYEFVAPPVWTTWEKDIRKRRETLDRIEAEIDNEVYRVYGMGDADRRAIEQDLNGGSDGDEHDRVKNGTDRARLAFQWVSYAVGVVLGRFLPGRAYTVGCGRFSPAVARELRSLASDTGLMVLEPADDDGLTARVGQALHLMLGPAAAELISMLPGNESSPAARLQRYLAGRFFQDHIRQYRRRPVYWLLQSPERCFGVYLHYGRIRGETLELLRRDHYLDRRMSWLRHVLADARTGRSRTDAARAEASPSACRKMEDELNDLSAFSASIKRIMEARNERGEVVGWQRESDDGVMLNLCPLWELMPGWSSEAVQVWRALESGRYDWSRTACRYWPDRVLSQCRRFKSFALAHGRGDVYEGPY